jgi:hypothetical protein
VHWVIRGGRYVCLYKWGEAMADGWISLHIGCGILLSTDLAPQHCSVLGHMALGSLSLVDTTCIRWCSPQWPSSHQCCSALCNAALSSLPCQLGQFLLPKDSGTCKVLYVYLSLISLADFWTSPALHLSAHVVGH